METRALLNFEQVGRDVLNPAFRAKINRFLQTSDSPIKAGKYNLLVYALAVFALTILAGVGEQKLTELIQKLLFRKKKEKAKATM